MQGSLVGSSPVAGRQGAREGASRRVVTAIRAQKQEQRVISKVKSALKHFDVQRSTAAVVLGNILMSLPAHAEPGKIFDFNLTLPIMVAEFLLLMVFLDKAWFGPVGKVLDSRDALIRGMLSNSKDNKAELEKLQKDAEAVVTAARQEAQKEIQAAQKKAEEENAKKLAEVKERIDKEVAEALAVLEREKEAASKNLDSEVDKLASEILARVLPKGVKV